MTRKSLAWLALALLVASGLAVAADIGEMVVKTLAVGTVVKAVAKPANDGINKLVGARNAPGISTKVVPVLSLGEKGYVGASQVAGSKSLVGKTKAVLQFEKDFNDRQYRVKLMMPINSNNPLNAKRVRGVGITGLLDVALSHNAYLLPPSVRWNTGDVLKAGAIAVATKEFGPQINGFINTVFRNEGSLPEGATKVVPYLDFGSKAYIGMMQVAGPSAGVAKVKAVWQYDQLFDRGRVRLRALVPSDSISPLSIRRVKGVGCTAIIDAMVLRARETERYPSHYAYFRHAPLFIGLGEDPHYRPPGWDRGRKEGWAKHGTPLLPPGLAKKESPPVVVVPGPPASPPPPGLGARPGRGPGEPQRERERTRLRVQEREREEEAGPPPGKGRGKGKNKG